MRFGTRSYFLVGYLSSRLHLDRPKVSQHVDLKSLHNPDFAQKVIL